MALYATVLRPTYNARSQKNIKRLSQGLVKNFLAVLLVLFILLNRRNSFYEPKLKA